MAPPFFSVCVNTKTFVALRLTEVSTLANIYDMEIENFRLRSHKIPSNFFFHFAFYRIWYMVELQALNWPIQGWVCQIPSGTWIRSTVLGIFGCISSKYLALFFFMSCVSYIFTYWIGTSCRFPKKIHHSIYAAMHLPLLFPRSFHCYPFGEWV